MKRKGRIEKKMHWRVSFRGGNIIRHESRKRDGSFGEVGYGFMLFLDVIRLPNFYDAGRKIEIEGEQE